jgi:hypothetical protein
LSLFEIGSFGSFFQCSLPPVLLSSDLLLITLASLDPGSPSLERRVPGSLSTANPFRNTSFSRYRPPNFSVSVSILWASPSRGGPPFCSPMLALSLRLAFCARTLAGGRRLTLTNNVTNGHLRGFRSGLRVMGLYPGFALVGTFDGRFAKRPYRGSLRLVADR